MQPIQKLCHPGYSYQLTYHIPLSNWNSLGAATCLCMCFCLWHVCVDVRLNIHAHYYLLMDNGNRCCLTSSEKANDQYCSTAVTFRSVHRTYIANVIITAKKNATGKCAHSHYKQQKTGISKLEIIVLHPSKCSTNSDSWSHWSSVADEYFWVAEMPLHA